jgi:hypothetical protein
MTTSRNGNGTATKSTTGSAMTATATVVKPSAPAAPEPAKPVPVTVDTATSDPKNLPAPLDLPPLEDRVLKIQILSDLVGRHEKLNTSCKLLQSLDLSSENRELKITIEDGDEEWATTNTDAIRVCVEGLISAHKSRVAELENQIRF